MDVEQIKRQLADAGVDRGSYDVDGTKRDEVYCLEKAPAGWIYYYRERGIRRDERVFASEDEATKFFMAAVLADPTTRAPR